MKAGELSLPLAGFGLGELVKAMLESLPWWYLRQNAARLTSLDTTQALVHGFELAQHKIYTIYELLKCVNRPVLQIQS